MTVLEAEKYLIVLVGLAVFITELHQARLVKKKGYAWVKYCLAFTGLYWAGYYIRSILGIDIGGHQVWVRTPILLTLTFIAVGAILSSRRIK